MVADELVAEAQVLAARAAQPGFLKEAVANPAVSHVFIHLSDRFARPEQAIQAMALETELLYAGQTIVSGTGRGRDRQRPRRGAELGFVTSQLAAGADPQAIQKNLTRSTTDDVSAVVMTDFKEKKAEVDRLQRRLDALGAAAPKSPRADREAEVEAALSCSTSWNCWLPTRPPGRRSRACCGSWG